MTIIDCRGMMCPMPILQVRLALNRLKLGDEIEIYADDPSFSEEFSRFCYLADLECLSRQVNDANISNKYEIYRAKLLK